VSRARRATLRRRPGTAADTVAGTVPDQQRGMSCRAAPGTPRNAHLRFNPVETR